MLNVVILSFIMLCVIMLSVGMLNVVELSVVAPSELCTMSLPANFSILGLILKLSVKDSDFYHVAGVRHRLAYAGS